MTDSVVQFLVNGGFNAVPRVREHDNLSAYRRSIYFPELLFSLGLSGYRNSRFLIKIEMQDQGYDYETVPAFVQSCGFYFPIPVPPDDILCSMKLSALLDRGKGRDFYDVMFLLSRYNPDFDYLSAMNGIRSKSELKTVVVRGSSWNFVASYCAVAYRDYYNPYFQAGDIGFRAVRP
jgi:hypothetical protein